MDLDTAIQLFDLVDNFDEYEEGLREVLTRVHTQEELDRARVVIDEKKQYMIDNSPEFNAIMEQRKREAKMRADESKAMHKAKMAEVTADANRIRSEAMMKAESARAGMRSDVDNWVAKTRVRKAPVEELENNNELWCPICVKEDKHRNIINNKPSCSTCWHPLVKKSELKDYPRKYRRAWKRRKK